MANKFWILTIIIPDHVMFFIQTHHINRMEFITNIIFHVDSSLAFDVQTPSSQGL